MRAASAILCLAQQRSWPEAPSHAGDTHHDSTALPSYATLQINMSTWQEACDCSQRNRAASSLQAAWYVKDLCDVLLECATLGVSQGPVSAHSNTCSLLQEEAQDPTPARRAY